MQFLCSEVHVGVMIHTCAAGLTGDVYAVNVVHFHVASGFVELQPVVAVFHVTHAHDAIAFRTGAAGAEGALAQVIALIMIVLFVVVVAGK